MEPREAYNNWAEQYDSNVNKTRDLEAIALREMLHEYFFDQCLELGCGTGKNTAWLIERSKKITAVDFSEEMLAVARNKTTSEKVKFIQADLNQEWQFEKAAFDIVIFSLVLEHIENLAKIFRKVSEVLKPGALLYVGELHPFKQYKGTKARFETSSGLQIVECYIHHISDFVGAAEENSLAMLRLKEYFDDDNRDTVPRIISMLFKKLN